MPIVDQTINVLFVKKNTSIMMVNVSKNVQKINITTGKKDSVVLVTIHVNIVGVQKIINVKHVK